ncbi:MAG TPA: hypothetical protein DCM05_18040 [Elusimicrobia bacterium]|nr:hypothetical protein [Elusimicrobiota bacterium]
MAWTLGQDRLGEEAVRELSAALISAAEAGVRVDVLAQGRAAAPVLKAVAGLSGKARVHRLVALGMNLDHLKAADPAFFRGFSRPENLEEWAGLWADGKHPPHVELFFKGRSAIRYPAFPRDADALAVEPERALRLAVLLLRAGSTMEDVLEQSLKPEGGEEAVEEGEPPVTCGDYKRCVRAGACEPEPCVNLGDQDAPCMYRDEKGAYCKWLKGGREWSNVSARCRAAFRGGVRPQFRFDQSFGFRCGPA